MNSNRKGKDGEREIANILQEWGYEDARRGQQYCGANGDADVVGLPGVHIEVKRVQKLNIEDALAQSEADSFEEIPVVFHRKNFEDWKATLRLEDFLRLYTAIIDAGIHWDSRRVRVSDEERILALVNNDEDKFERIMKIVSEQEVYYD